MSLDVIGTEFEDAAQVELPSSMREALNLRTELTREEVSQALAGTGWIATNLRNGVYEGALGESGFELVQGQLDEDGDLQATTDSLPVLRALKVGNRVKFVLKSGKPNENMSIYLDEIAA
jgi:hypothetical protein